MKRSEISCCVDGCTRCGTRADADGNLLCAEHWGSLVTPCDSCEGCDCGAKPKCMVAGCKGEGIVKHIKTGSTYCVDHAWRSDREEVQSKPAENEWSEADIIRAQSWGIKVGEA